MTSSAANVVQPRQFQSSDEITSFIWGVTDLLQGPSRHSPRGTYTPALLWPYSGSSVPTGHADVKDLDIGVEGKLRRAGTANPATG
jgi:hypothetical protein